MKTIIYDEGDRLELSNETLDNENFIEVHIHQPSMGASADTEATITVPVKDLMRAVAGFMPEVSGCRC